MCRPRGAESIWSARSVRSRLTLVATEALRTSQLTELTASGRTSKVTTRPTRQTQVSQGRTEAATLLRDRLPAVSSGRRAHLENGIEDEKANAGNRCAAFEQRSDCLITKALRIKDNKTKLVSWTDASHQQVQACRWLSDLMTVQQFAVGPSDDLDGEFDPGSGRTLAACLTHASRTRSKQWQHCGRPSGERVSNT